ncbi:hypothetical protein AXE80_08090 [Wenyingzhuangia fucanilytica]|uniref:CBM-cenC domain-containing protein n=1 Tax=Wenyingzhuangia fucanilytica TaxID=1790137 RepID=A0A1B1Y654_9FLAO|nr:hypothetical protein [Wenyingzhuangia fucanilytica]ANW96240.1 hypothetical protein AXE80_08090 [Wenyingzhuangia fucanilytica]
MLKNKFKISFITFAILGLSITANAQITGADQASFDFENGSPEHWTQMKGFESSTEQVASGEKSMKVAFDDYSNVGKGPKLQSFRGKAAAPGFFDLKAGTYEMSVKVYTEGEVPRFLQISLSGPAKVNSKFDDLDKQAKNSWQTLTSTFTIDKDAKKNWLSVSFFVFPKSGSGTVYIDDFKITQK